MELEERQNANYSSDSIDASTKSVPVTRNVRFLNNICRLTYRNSHDIEHKGEEGKIKYLNPCLWTLYPSYEIKDGRKLMLIILYLG